MDDNEDSAQNEIAGLRRELEFERLNRSNHDKTLRIEEQLRALERILDDGLVHAKQASTRAYATISVIFAVLGFIGWATINSAIDSRVKNEFEKNNYEKRIEELVSKTEARVLALNSEVDKLANEARTILDKFRNTADEQMLLVQSYTENLIRENPDIASSEGAKQAGLKLTPIFGVTPGVTTREEMKNLVDSGKLDMFGNQSDGKNIKTYSFKYGDIHFTVVGSDYTANKFDTVSYIEYWGDKQLPLGFSTKSSLDEAQKLAEKYFYWLGTQSFRGLVFSNKENGPILLEIGLNFEKPNELTYSIYGPI